jgi:hypothetical protein
LKATTRENNAIILASRDELWRQGDLAWKLHESQLETYSAIKESDDDYLLEVGRQWGKTTLCATITAEEMIKSPGKRWVYGASTLNNLREFILPTFNWLFSDAPDDVKPTWKHVDGHLVFPNQAWTHLFGAENMLNADRGRGPKAIGGCLDEAAYMPVLTYVLNDIVGPSLIHSAKEGSKRGGRVILSSSPAREPDHPFSKLADHLKSIGRYTNKNIFDNPLLSKERVESIIEEAATRYGLHVDDYIKTAAFKREYLAERAIETSLVVMGADWIENQDRCTVPVDRPGYFDGYVGLDLGGVDPHAAVFAYWHHERQALVVEDEVLLIRGENTAQLADEIKAKEKDLWGDKAWQGTLRGLVDVEYHNVPDWLRTAMDANSPKQPYLRVIDNDIQLARDLHQLHGISFLPTAKDDKVLQVNALRVLVRQGRLLVNPRCKNLIRHLRKTLWKDAKMTTYQRTQDDFGIMEHGDLLDALIYLHRNVNKNRNPAPPKLSYLEQSGLANGWVKEDNPLGALFARRRR